MQSTTRGYGLDTLSKLELSIYNGFKCGGYYIFVEICNNDSCCEDQITPNPEIGFDQGDKINVELNDCKSMVVSFANKNDFKISLTSWNEMNVS